MVRLVYSNILCALSLRHHPYQWPYLAHNYSSLSRATQIESFRHTMAQSVIMLTEYLSPGGYQIYHQSSLPPEVFLYPIGPQWEEPFKLSNWSMDSRVLDRVAERTAYLIYIDPCEGKFRRRPNQETNSLESVYDVLEQNRIPLSQVIIVNNSANLTELNRKARQGMDYAQAFHIPWLRNHYRDIPSSETLPSRRFICLNNTWKSHRLILALELDRRGLSDQCYLSFADNPPLSPIMADHPYHNLSSNLEMAFDHFSYLEEDRQDLRVKVDLLRQRLPLRLDQGYDPRLDYTAEDLAVFHRDSLVSVITETYYLEDEIHITEKTWRPINLRHPFVLVASYRTLDYLRQQGFKTFGEFWNEDYDRVCDPKVRMDRILRVLEDIASWDITRVKEFQRHSRSICDYNYDLLASKCRRNSSSLPEFQTLGNYLSGLDK